MYHLAGDFIEKCNIMYDGSSQIYMMCVYRTLKSLFGFILK